MRQSRSGLAIQDSVAGLSKSTLQEQYLTSSPTGQVSLAQLSMHWLMYRCCHLPAQDAVRNGWYLSDDIRDLQDYDNQYNLSTVMVDMVHLARVFGGRLILFKTQSDDEGYSIPFNIDGVDKYEGMVAIDSQYAQPMISAETNDPTSEFFMKPQFWRIGTKVIHHSHLHICIPFNVPATLKSRYSYLGISLVQQIQDRVFSAERCANEAEQLLISKRMIGLKVSDAALMNPSKLTDNLTNWTNTMNNFGIRVLGSEEEIIQHDTSLADLPAVVEQQYQLIAAASGIPENKLLGLGTTGMNNTGDYSIKTYYESLKGIQNNQLTPLLSRHYQLLQKSLGKEVTPIEILWEPLDMPTSKEAAEITNIEAQRDLALFNIGAVDSDDVRKRINNTTGSGYYADEEEQEQQEYPEDSQ